MAFVLLDCAVGTELARRGVDVERPGWTAAAIVEAPEVLRAVHAEAIAAGADVLTANTFRTHAVNVQPLGCEAATLTQRAVAIAREAVAQHEQSTRYEPDEPNEPNEQGEPNEASERLPVRVFGSVAPVADCYDAAAVPSDERLAEAHAGHAEHLADAGVDGVLIETMTTTRELRIAIAANRAAGERVNGTWRNGASQTGPRPVWASVAIRPDGRLYSGERFDNAIAVALQEGATAVLANCFPATIGQQLAATLARCCEPTGTPWGLQANTGRLTAAGTWADDGDTSPAAYAGHAAAWRAAGAQLIGGCCGTTPEHLRTIRAAIARMS